MKKEPGNSTGDPPIQQAGPSSSGKKKKKKRQDKSAKEEPSTQADDTKPAEVRPVFMRSFTIGRLTFVHLPLTCFKSKMFNNYSTIYTLELFEF